MEILAGELDIEWAQAYRREWNDAPEAYVAHGVVGWGRSRRLARAQDRARHFKAYLGVQHFDPARWYGTGDPVARFFLSVFVQNRTVALRTYPTAGAALADLRAFHASLPVCDADR